MVIIIIVNIITALTILLGGCCMKKYAVSHSDHSIGFRTERSVSSEEAWCFANQKCGRYWIILGAVGFILSIAALFIVRSENAEGIVQFILLILQTSAVIASMAAVEYQLKKRENNGE